MANFAGFDFNSGFPKRCLIDKANPDAVKFQKDLLIFEYVIGVELTMDRDKK